MIPRVTSKTNSKRSAGIRSRLPLLLMLSLQQGASPISAETIVVSVTAPGYDLREAPVSLLLPTQRAAATPANASVPQGAVAVHGQWEPVDNSRMRLTFVARDIKANTARTFAVRTDVAPARAAVEVKLNGANAEFWIGGQLFTRYDTVTGPNKPYFYPLFAPGNHQIVRHWPVEERAGQTQDHPHHRGLWFTHGQLNGIDFWLEKGNVGKTVHSAYQTLQSGAVYGLLRTSTNWVAPNGQTLAEDRREVRVYNLRDGYLMDLLIEVRALDKPLTWGDTKEGTLALRVADSMRAAVEKGQTAQGHILNANGDRDAVAWGKAAPWCAYYGPVDGAMVGVAMMDEPHNLRHPTHWHVRDYGLFAANPFGLHDFVRNTPAGAGTITMAAGEKRAFRYRLLFHKGTPAEAGVARAWQAYSQPPTVQLLPPD
ncbi:MAG: hypothetical protein JWN98_388 [Abditibacteriota bacterium]|nr:hypothetical protein [Abditibacteriota bacterium]